MKPLLLLVDLQEDFLAIPSLEPHRERVTANAARLLALCRKRGWPVCHVWMVLRREPDRRMAHWRAADRWACLAGSPGAATPPELEPIAGEIVVEKSVFSPWVENDLAKIARRAGADTLLVAGLNLHACVRLTAVDAYQRGFPVWIVEDATGADIPLAAAQTYEYLRRHGIGFLDTDRLEQSPPALPYRADRGASERVAAALAQLAPLARPALPDPLARARLLGAAADRIERDGESLAHRITVEISKPLRHARLEVARSAALLRALGARLLEQRLDFHNGEARLRRTPHGVVGLITPYNNPLAIAVGLWGAAFAYGNRVLWKPSPLAPGIAADLQNLLGAAGLPEGELALMDGDSDTGLELAAHPGVHAVCFTGSRANGWRVSQACAAANKPLQAELGGNNAAIVWHDVHDPAGVAQKIALGAFECAGQRCTATRRLILPRSIHTQFSAQLEAAVARLSCGDPLDPGVDVGPLVTPAHARQVRECVGRAARRGARVSNPANAPEGDSFVLPALVYTDDAGAEIVQEETFGPVLVVQRADDWDHAIALANGVRQGLACSLFTTDPARAHDFIERAQCGILRINADPSGAGVDSPFAGWKQSGSGPPHHGAANIEFFTRWQSVYGDPGGA